MNVSMACQRDVEDERESVYLAGKCLLLAKPHVRARSDEYVDLVRRQLETVHMQLRNRLERVDCESKPQLLVRQQPVNDVSDVLL
jgi:hypothetical protein